MIVQILIVNTAFYIYGNIRLKEICILNSFEQIKENIIAGSAFSARLGSSAVAFIPDPPGHRRLPEDTPGHLYLVFILFHLTTKMPYSAEKV